MAAKLLFLYLLLVAGLQVALAAPLVPRQSFGTFGEIVNTGGEGHTTGPNITVRSDGALSEESERVVADLRNVVRAAHLVPRQSFGTFGEIVNTGGEGHTTSPNITARADLKVARDVPLIRRVSPGAAILNFFKKVFGVTDSD